MEEFPSNSQRRKPQERKQPEEKKSVKPVVSGGVTRRKKPLGRRFAEFFTGDDTKGVMEYVLMDILIPSAKDTIADAVSQGVERKLFGEARPRRGSSIRVGAANAWTAYNRPPAGRPDPRGSRLDRRSRATHKFDEIVFDSRFDAEEVLGTLANLIAEYEQATVRDFYDAVGETATFTDEKYGWTDLEGSSVRRVGGGGYVIILPRPIELD